MKKAAKLQDERLLAEIRQREKVQIDLNNMLKQMNSLKTGATGSLTYD